MLLLAYLYLVACYLLLLPLLLPVLMMMMMTKRGLNDGKRSFTKGAFKQCCRMMTMIMKWRKQTRERERESSLLAEAQLKLIAQIKMKDLVRQNIRSTCVSGSVLGNLKQADFACCCCSNLKASHDQCFVGRTRARKRQTDSLRVREPSTGAC